MQRIAIMVNDSVCDGHRAQLWSFVPRLMKSYDSSRDADGFAAALIEKMLCDVVMRHRVALRQIECETWIKIFDQAIRKFDDVIKRQPVAHVDWSPLSPESLARSHPALDKMHENHTTAGLWSAVYPPDSPFSVLNDKIVQALIADTEAMLSNDKIFMSLVSPLYVPA